MCGGGGGAAPHARNDLRTGRYLNVSGNEGWVCWDQQLGGGARSKDGSAVTSARTLFKNRTSPGGKGMLTPPRHGTGGWVSCSNTHRGTTRWSITQPTAAHNTHGSFPNIQVKHGARDHSLRKVLLRRPRPVSPLWQARGTWAPPPPRASQPLPLVSPPPGLPSAVSPPVTRKALRERAQQSHRAHPGAPRGTHREHGQGHGGGYSAGTTSTCVCV